MNPNFDTVIIGAGQGGPLARMLAKGGQRVALIEKHFVGGSCTNVGCTPTKAHIAAAKVAHVIRTSNDFGVDSHLVNIDLAAVARRSRRIVEEFRRENEEYLLSTPRLELIYGIGRFRGHDTVEVQQQNGRELTVQAKNFVVAVGTHSEIPAIEGLSEVPFITHVEALALERVPPDLLIMGGGYISCEFAQMFARFGSRVTIVQSAEQLMPREDEDVASAIADILRDSGVEVVLGCEVKRVGKTNDGLKAIWHEEERNFSHLLVATGLAPQTRNIGLEGAGVDIDEEGYIRTSDYLRTTNQSIYALGDCKGGPQFTHIAYDDARILRDGLLRGTWRSIQERPVPYTVFIDPQLGRIGLSEREAQKANKKFDVVRLEMKDTARGIETGQIRGFWKILIERDTEQILGGALLSGEGGETMAILQMAMMAKMPYMALRDAVLAHPTWAESLNNVFLRFDEQIAAKNNVRSPKGELEELRHSKRAFGQ
ncbi:mercuric reductase [bacterium]|nr:MAG: mercuric reductase [bacterium]